MTEFRQMNFILDAYLRQLNTALQKWFNLETETSIFYYVQALIIVNGNLHNRVLNKISNGVYATVSFNKMEPKIQQAKQLARLHWIYSLGLLDMIILIENFDISCVISVCFIWMPWITWTVSTVIKHPYHDTWIKLLNLD